MSAALDGITVIALEQAVAAPYASSRLADAGARVIKVEAPRGDFARQYDSIVHGQSAYFVWLNRGKESIDLNLKTAADAALLHRMIARADVFIQNLRPGVTDGLGFASRSLRDSNPRLITCDISGYGADGPYSGRKAYDLLMQAETGLAAVTGDQDSIGRVGISVCDVAAGMTAFAAILEKLYARERTGDGAAIDVSLFDCIADWMTVPFLYQEHTGAAPPRVGLQHPSIAPYGMFQCNGSEQIVIAVQNEAEWRRFCEQVLQQPQLGADPLFSSNEKRVRERARLDSVINAVFNTLSRRELLERLDAGGIAYGFVNSVAEFCRHPQLRRVQQRIPGGTVQVIAPPVRCADGSPALGAVPSLGEHARSLREEFAR